MKNTFEKSFAFLKDDPSFSFEKEEFNGQDLRIKFIFRDIRFSLESDRRQIGLYVTPFRHPDQAVNIVNLLSFRGLKTESKFYADVRDLKQCYTLQIEWLASIVEENLLEIIAFCSSGDYTNNCQRLREYMVKTHPSLFAGLKP